MTKMSSDALLNHFQDYSLRLQKASQDIPWDKVVKLTEELGRIQESGKGTFWLCGNGGSAGNANHLANDYVYPVAKHGAPAINAVSLAANPSVLTCLGNDIGYDRVFSYQIECFAQQGDVLLAFSGSGNSPNILNAITAAKDRGVVTFAVLGYDGGKALDLVDYAIHTPVDDMQIAEDLQTVIGHSIVQVLCRP